MPHTAAGMMYSPGWRKATDGGKEKGRKVTLAGRRRDNGLW